MEPSELFSHPDVPEFVGDAPETPAEPMQNPAFSDRPHRD